MADIELGQDYNRAPANLCPYCKKPLHLILDAFKPEITKIVRSNCPYCGGEIYAAIMIITDRTQHALINDIQAILDMFNPQLITTIDNPQKGGGN